jgi:DNA-binding NarL/FixJ family response regulator
LSARWQFSDRLLEDNAKDGTPRFEVFWRSLVWISALAGWTSVPSLKPGSATLLNYREQYPINCEHLEHEIIQRMLDELGIALVEDDARFRQSLQLLIDGSPGFKCVGAWQTVEIALRARELGTADVVLLDLHLPGMDGDEGVELILDRYPDLLVLMFTAYGDEERVFNSLCRGACGYLLKSTTPVRLLEALREAADGGSPMSPSIARKVVRLFRETVPPSIEHHSLTQRETELLAALAGGHTYQSSAANLGISVNTVRSHIRSIYDKLKVHSQSEAVSKALRAGLI